MKCFLCKEIGFEEEEMHKVRLDNEILVEICDFCYGKGMEIENQQYDQHLSDVSC